MSKKSFLSGVLVAAGIVLCLTVGDGFSGERAVFTPGWIFHGRDVGFFVGIEKGYYKKAGIDPGITPGAGGSDVVAKVASGTHTFGLSGMGAVVAGRSRGIKVRNVGMYHDKPLDTIFTMEGSGINKPKDLEGRVLGTTAKDAPAMLFPSLAVLNGIDQSKLKWVYMNPPAKLPSLLAGKVDAILMFQSSYPVVALIAKKKGKKVKSILYADWGLDVYSAGIIAREDTIEKNPDLVRRWVSATYRASAWAVEHPQEATKIFHKVNPNTSLVVSRKMWDITVEHLMTPYAMKHGIGMMSREKMAKSQGIISKALKVKSGPVEGLFTNEFLPKLFPKKPGM